MKKDEQRAKSNDNNQVQGFVFGINLQGSEQVVMEGIKAFTHAMAKGGGVLLTPVARPILPSATAGKPKSNAAGTVVIEQNEETAEVPEEQVETSEQEEVEEGLSNGSGQKRQYNFKTPKYMDDLDFSKASKSLEDFAKEKGDPTDVMDKYILTVVWFKKHMAIEEVTVHHIFTAFDNVGWKSEMPSNPSVPLRDLKSKKHMLTRETGAEGYKVNFKGEQHVEKMGVTK